jgi:protein dithiol oxidoreductase (disulfide-forming)
MNPRRRRLSLLTAALLLPWPAAALDLMEEVDYRVIPQQPLADPARIEVVEFFYYGCYWCNEAQPYVEDWLRRKPADVVFRLQPAIRNTRWIPLTKAFYVLEAEGKLGALHGPLFRSYHRDELNLEDETVLTDWLVRHGLKRDRVEALLASSELMAKVEAARAVTYAYQVDTTPSVVVDGRYLTSSGMAGGVAALMEIVDALVAIVRDERPAGAR